MICIYASELSGCVGLNKYKTIDEMAIKIWERVDKVSFQKALERNMIYPKISIEEKLTNIYIKEKVFNTINSENYVTDLQWLLLELDDEIDEDKTNSPRSGLALTKNPQSGLFFTQNQLKSFVFTERGKNAENSTLDNAEKSLGKKIKERNSKFYKKYLDIYGNEINIRQLTLENKVSILSTTFLLGGKVDGITDDGKLVEIKNRQYRLFSTTPIYEKIQIHAYMYITNIFSCHLVQCYNNIIESQNIDFDKNFWSSILKRLTSFIKSLQYLLNNLETQDLLLNEKLFNVDF